ncbi:hypothetical protein FJQ54_04430 [Sandaracinobacter neustonicus]|uniref:Uncharacterized protein n=1 Tax=Sandaracinobacter neustonicus TaxID=1715348 RepID=A0A501XQW7_9SPHN|nr:hypothetical protein [Sandaracinobacter neustonicus]TPE63098.1 hypothetical protein FJQ54_04430 [Sandaracinobacter neustonicus]
MDTKPTSCLGSTGHATPKRRMRIVLRRRQSAPRPTQPGSSSPCPGVFSDLPAVMPVVCEEIAILRAHLAREIEAILFDEIDGPFL